MSRQDESVTKIIREVIAARAKDELIPDETILAVQPELHDTLHEELSTLGPVDMTDPSKEDGSRNFPTIPGYLVVDCIGGGSQASVYEGVMLSTSRRVAIKVLHGGQFSSEESKARFLREKETLARLSHRNIVSILDRIVTPRGDDCLIMDYVKGVTLKEYLLQTTADVETAIQSRKEMLGVFIKTSRAVGAAHKAGVVHRDLKPSNIQLDMEGEPYVLDFGLARNMPSAPASELNSHTTDEPVTITGQFVGSLPWASPEQAIGDSGHVTARSDVYSLGVILYQIITAGALPYPTSGSMVEALDRILRQTPASPTMVLARRCRLSRGVGLAAVSSPSIDPMMESVVLRALSKRPEVRYADADELADAVEQAMNSQVVEASVSAPEDTSTKPKRLKRRWVAGLAFVLLALSVLILNMRSTPRSSTASLTSDESPLSVPSLAADNEVDAETADGLPGTSVGADGPGQPGAASNAAITRETLAATEELSRPKAVETQTTGASPSKQLNVPDNYPSIGEALEHAAAGEVVLVHPRATGYRERLTITRDVTIKGLGPSQIDVSSDGGVIITVKSGVKATFEQLAFAPSEADSIAAPTGIASDGATILFKNCRVSGFAQSALKASGGTIELQSCVFDNNRGVGIDAIGSDLVMYDCTVQKCGAYGLWIREYQTLNVRRCTFQDNTGIGLLAVCSKPSVVSIDNCDFKTNSLGGLELGGPASGSVRGGKYSSNGKCGLRLRGIEGGIVIAGVTVSGTSDGNGIEVGTSQQVTLENCSAVDNREGDGCRIWPTSTDIQLIGGEFSRNKNGLRVLQGSSAVLRDSSVAPLSASHNDEHGLIVERSVIEVLGGIFDWNVKGDGIIALDCDSVVISNGTTCSHNGHHGINLARKNKSVHISKKVECANNATNGLTVDHGSHAKVTKCVFRSNKANGIHAGQPGSFVDANGNCCEHNQHQGILFTHGAIDGVLEGNECLQNTACGICVVSESANIKILNNTCNGSILESGIFVSESSSHCDITLNHCENNALVGITVRKGAVCKLRDNKCIKNMVGIECWDKGSVITLLGRNLCQENKTSGLNMGPGTDCKGSGILFSRNEKCGIEIHGDSKANCNRIAKPNQFGPGDKRCCEN